MPNNPPLPEAAGSLDPESAKTALISLTPIRPPSIDVPVAVPPSPEESEESRAIAVIERVFARPEFAGLSEPQRAALRAIATGQPREVVLERAGVSISTLRSWTADPRYNAAREAWRIEVMERARQRMRDLIPRARAVLEERRKNPGEPPKPKVRRSRKKPGL